MVFPEGGFVNGGFNYFKSFSKSCVTTNFSTDKKVKLLFSVILIYTHLFERKKGKPVIVIRIIFRSARTSYRAFDSRPSTHPPVRNNFSWVHRWAVTLPPGLRYPSNCIFYESWWCQLSNSDENTNTKTNTDTNTNTETNKGKTNDSYDVIYCLKGDDKRILNMICYRQRL